MTIVFLGFVAEQFAASAIYFSIVWVVVQLATNGVKLGAKWLILGIFATAFIGGLARFAFWIVSGESAGTPLGEKATSFFFLVLPIVVAIGLCAFLRARAKENRVRLDLICNS